MEEALDRILEGCKLARELETSITITQGLSNNLDYLFKTTEEIVRAFNAAMNSLNSVNSSLPVRSNMVVGDGGAVEGSSHGATSMFQALDILQSGGFEQANMLFSPTQPSSVGLKMPVVSVVATTGMELGGSSAYGNNAFEATNAETGGIHGLMQMATEGPSGSARGRVGSPSQRSTRRRRDNHERTTHRVLAVRTGNNEMPPDDGYTWRKYGQKEILGCRFPRSYFRCTHKNYYGCEAKKQVQRLDEDPYTYEIVYCGRHSCLTSTTPLLIPSFAPANAVITSAVAPIITNTATASTSNINIATNTQIESSMIGATMAPEMHPSTPVHLSNWLTRDLPEGRPVADMADVLFNSGSSSSSMDAFFYSKDEN